jgi:flagellar basal-body rod protein FlgB
MAFDPIRSDSALSVSRLALDGMALRQDINSSNIANIDTPGYTAKEVNFEQTLKNVMSGETKENLSLTLTNPRHIDIPGSSVLFRVTDNKTGTARADGNNVDIDKELVQMNETGIRQQAITQVMARKLRLIKDITKIR